MATERALEREYEVPADEPPAATCPYCGRPFRSERYATFHVGVEHAEVCSEAERDAFDEERDDEEYELFTFHFKAAVTVFLVYFLFTFIYALVWSS
ncbi:DUF7410 domain-containing protein [Natrinema salifodinae]|uniref:C2H2-type domain-containing protein n=1 Tax=Natrinema salifodinae TaxID=1202768 RepID=A0A1I0P424_9EURY|nr:hypothetical protein [Natrinema salifodinae]SEW09099.1 hypothetical protein SAMN05216285_2126 [Natrinema salifodinae]